MSTFKGSLGKIVVAAAFASSVAAVTPANAALVQLGFILDESGSIGATNWGIITQGVSDAIDLIPVGGPNTYEISIVTFGSAVNTRAQNVVINSIAARDTLSDAIAAYSYANGGATNFAIAFSAMSAALDNTANPDLTYVNFSTDGQQNAGGDGIAERNAMIANASVDNISIEGIGGGVDANDLQTNFCYPQACDATSPYSFPTQGFYIGVADATAYAAAIQNKVLIVTDQLPEPGTLALLGLGIVGLGVQRLRPRRMG